MTPYGQAPAAAPAAYSNYGYAQAPPPAPAPQQTFGFESPPAAPAWGAPLPAYYSEQAPPAVNTSAAPGTPGGYGGGNTPQSQMTYGSTPSFAQPPRQQQQPGQYGGY
jgi:hypothetical protein